jgi:hypothetical protein
MDHTNMTWFATIQSHLWQLGTNNGQHKVMVSLWSL